MAKYTKLIESAARVPEPRGAQRTEIIARYLQAVESSQSESARSHRFGILLNELLGHEAGFIEDYLSGIETSLSVKQKDRMLRGEADNLFGNVIVEFEKNIPKKRAEAEGQLKRYTAIAWSQEPLDARRPYLCIATDGVRFVTYSPTLVDATAKDIIPEQVRLNVLEDVDWTMLKPADVFYWLDRYFLRQQILTPTSEEIVRDFGARSHAVQTATDALLRLWHSLEAQSDFAVIYDSWEKYLRIVYGTTVADDELFVRHTYLATLAKLMAWMRITGEQTLPADAQIIGMLEGQLFKQLGIENFIEEDFFSWLVRAEAQPVAVGVVHWLFSLLQHYNLRELSEDVLKSLYQELVDPETRHDLGEFYTPDWLAQRIVNQALDANPWAALLDPACGSGTFLYLAVKGKREKLGDKLETLRHILDAIYGADIHPLAVIVAKTNYILALGDLLKKRKGTLTIPIYLANTIRLPEREAKASLFNQLVSYRVELEEREVYIPELLLADLARYDQAIELAKEFARQQHGKTIALEPFRNFLAVQRFAGADDEQLVFSLFNIAKILKAFIDDKRDTIWAYVLKNSYKPLFFKRKFDFVVGNPPWIAFRYMEPTYQAFLKRQITQDYKLLRGRGELITHLEVATLFLVRAADLYLKTGGTIAFVLPKSIFSADQHDGLRRRTFQSSEDVMETLTWRELWDCENVSPLFNVPSCVLFAERRDVPRQTRANPVEPLIAGQILSGKLERKNASLAEAESALKVADVEFSLHTRGKRSYWATGKAGATQAASYYKKHFAQGATIVPRSFWFVQVKPSPLGFDPDAPLVQTDPRAIELAKAPYQDVHFEGNVESNFLYATLLSTDLLPFGYLDYRFVVLPIEPDGDHYQLMDASEARERGYLHLAHWLDRAEKEWTKLRTAKAEYMNIYERLDRVHALTNQNPQTKYRVIYNKSGTFLTAAVAKNAPIKFEVSGQEIETRGFLTDHVTYCFDTSNPNEAHYLGALLNAPMVDELIKPMQSRGLWGPRDIHKKVLELPVPQFDAKNPTHQHLSELGKECSRKVQHWLASGGAGEIKSIGKFRGMTRAMLAEELAEIDGLVKRILK